MTSLLPHSDLVLAVALVFGVGVPILYAKDQPVLALLLLFVCGLLFVMGIKARALVLHYANALPKKDRRVLVRAFLLLTHRDKREWEQLPTRLKTTDVGILCEAYLTSGDDQLLNKAGEILGGPHWIVSLER